jgi:hypothetical protein
MASWNKVKKFGSSVWGTINPFDDYSGTQALGNVLTRASDIASSPTSFMNKVGYALTPQRAYASNAPQPNSWDAQGQPTFNNAVSNTPPQGAQGGLSNQYSATAGGTGGSGGASFVPVVFNGQTYTDINSYTNAINAAAQTEYDRQLKQIERSYQSGLIDLSQKENLIKQNRDTIRLQSEDLLRQYEQNKEGLGTARTQTLQSQSGYFNAIAPDTYQSQQGSYADEVEKEYGKSLGNLESQRATNERAISLSQGELDTQAQNIARAREDLNLQNQSNIYGLQQALQSQKDQLANQKLDFQNKVSNVSAGSSAKTTNYSTADLVAGLAGQYQQFASVPGLTGDMKKQALSNSLSQTGIDKKSQDTILSWFYANVVPQLGN